MASSNELRKVTNMNDRRTESVDPLNLRNLPPVSTDHDGWPAIRAALDEGPNHSRKRRIAGGALAAAATVVLAVAVTLSPTPSGPVTPIDMDSAGVSPGEESVPAPLEEPTVESLMVMSRQLEDRLRQYRDRTGELPTASVVYQVELQDLIVQVDEGLSRNPGSRELWAQRVSLLMDSARLYENNLRRDYYRMASL